MLLWERYSIPVLQVRQLIAGGLKPPLNNYWSRRFGYKKEALQAEGLHILTLYLIEILSIYTKYKLTN
jgi:hypothetical protein